MTRGYRQDYKGAELAAWAEKSRATGARRVWAYFNTDRDGYAIKNARELLRQLRWMREETAAGAAVVSWE